MEKQNEMQIFVGKEIINIDSPEDYTTLTNELKEKHYFDKKNIYFMY